MIHTREIKSLFS